MDYDRNNRIYVIQEGLHMSNLYDVIILGAGPAGLAAGLYAGRSCLKTLIIEKGQDGGQIAMTDEIENYPGQMLEGESGVTLVARMAKQAKQFGAERVRDNIKSVSLEGSVKKVAGRKGEYLGKTLIIATGAFPRPIGCKNEAQFTGAGISYCATCDGMFFRDLEVFVVGGGDAAVEEALFLTKFARKVTIIHRRDQLRAAKSIQEKAFRNPKIAFLWDSVLEEVDGEDALNKLVVKNVKSGELTTIEADPADGLLDVLVIKKVSRFQVPGVIGKFKDGRYKELQNLIRHYRTDKLRIICDKPTAINLDGELRTAQTVEMSIAKEKVRFFYPKGLSWKKEPAAVK